MDKGQTRDASAVEPRPTETIPVPTIVACALGPTLPAGRQGEKLRCGIPWPIGALPEGRTLVLANPDGIAIPHQVEILERWRDGSARWIELDWCVGGSEQTWALSPQPAPITSSDEEFGTFTVTEQNADIIVRAENHDASRQFRLLHRTDAFPCAGFEISEDLANKTDQPGDSGPLRVAGGLTLRDQEGHLLPIETGPFQVATIGELRTTITVTGTVALADGGLPLLLNATFDLYLENFEVQLRICLHNPRPAGHPNGKWGLGRPGAVFFTEITQNWSVPIAQSEAALSIAPGEPFNAADAPVALYQESSGGDQWNCANHLNRSGQVPMNLRGFRGSIGEREVAGDRATPAVLLRREIAVGLASEHFWEVFPRAMAADPTTSRLNFSPFPSAFPDTLELQGGEQTTSVHRLVIGRPALVEARLDQIRNPLVPGATPSWYQRCDVEAALDAKSSVPETQSYDELVDELIDGPRSFFAKREIVDEFGWRNFGDVFADHESALNEDGAVFISHYNNQYDLIHGFAIQFMRTGDPRWHRLMDTLAQHVTDIDIYHTDGDKAAYNHGMFWHTDHYVDAGLSNHRSYPDSPKVAGGGPAAGHLYNAGLMTHFFLTGNRVSRSAAIELGEYVIAADDGNRTIYRFLSREYTGHVSESGYRSSHGPGRSPANAVSALLVAHRLSGDDGLLEKAERLIERCIDPRDDLDDGRLEDIENRWFYTVFLQSLIKYLRHKQELGQHDSAREFAQSALIKYARWLYAHDGPYLEHPEKLEYPTETWAAQDLRKPEILNAASNLVDEDERIRFRARATALRENALSQLREYETRSCARPAALVLLHHRLRPIPLEPYRGPTQLRPGIPATFVPQKERAKRRLIALASVGLVSIVGLVWHMLKATHS